MPPPFATSGPALATMCRALPAIRRSLAALLLTLAVSSPAAARTWLVPAELPTIAAGLDSAASASADTVLVACGTYLESSLVLPPGVTLRGDGPPGCVTIDAAGAARILDVENGVSRTRVENLRFTNGADTTGAFPDGTGGAIRLRNCTQIEIRGCTFDSNVARRGGAIAMLDCDLVILEACAFADNDGGGSNWAAGGGIYAQASTGAIDSCSFTDNTAISDAGLGDGGGIFADQCILNLTDCTFERNDAAAGGGGFYSFHLDYSTFTRCTFSDNFAVAGGAIYLETSRSTAWDCAFLDNRAPSGGALFAGEGSTSRFFGCTFDRNEATLHSGGALACWESRPGFTDCTFADNVTPVYGGAAFLAGISAIDFLRCAFVGNQAGAGGGGVRVEDASLATIGGCTFAANAAPTGGGISVVFQSTAEIDSTIVAFGTQGEAIACGPDATVEAACTDVFGNAGGDWTGCLAALAGQNGNFSADPNFCDLASGNLSLTLPDSPALPGGNACGVRVGARDAGCGCPAGATILVPSDHPTIADALAAALPGDVVGICDGTWAESIDLVSGVHVIGVHRDFATVTGNAAAIPDAVLRARAITDSTVVAGLTLDASGALPNTVVSESLSTGLHLRANTITGATVAGVVNGPASRVTLGGAPGLANDLFGNGGATPIHLRNLNTTGDSLDAAYNYWGTKMHAEVLATLEGPVRFCPYVNEDHEEVACPPADPTDAPPAGSSPIDLAVGPNPFGATTGIAFSVESPGATVTLEILDVTGRRVRTLVRGPLPPGVHRLRWDGRDTTGHASAPGVYFARLVSGSVGTVRKLVRLR